MVEAIGLDLGEPFPAPGKTIVIDVPGWTTMSTVPGGKKTVTEVLQEALDDMFVHLLHSDPISPSSWRVAGWNADVRRVTVQIIEN